MKLISIGIICALIILVYTQLSIFVIQPLGALPEGKTIVISRFNSANFVDSPDALCLRTIGKVNLMCRMTAIMKVSGQDIYARLPYSEWLYLYTTNGNTYQIN